MNKRWVTLLEIIIALFVFAVGILAVVRVITTNISVIDMMKVKIQAQSLAKEWIDMIFSIRDTNLARGMNWNCAYLSPEAINALQNGVNYAWQICAASFTEGSFFKVSLDPQWGIVAAVTTTGNDFETAFTNNALWPNTNNADYTWFLLTHANEWTWAMFARYISFWTVTQSWGSLDTNKLLKVTSHVLYQKWGIKWEVTLESFIWAIKK